MKKLILGVCFLVMFCLTTYNSISDYAIAFPTPLAIWVDGSGSSITSANGRLIGLTITWEEQGLKLATDITVICDIAYPLETCWWLSDFGKQFNYGTVYSGNYSGDPTTTNHLHAR
jgi:hypothetical protein